MEAITLKDVQETFPNLKAEENVIKFIGEEGKEITEVYHFISNIKGNPDLSLLIRGYEEFQEIKALPLEQINLFKDYLGLYHNGIVEVLLTDVGFRSFVSDKRLEQQPLEIRINYKRNELLIRIRQNPETSIIKSVGNHIRGAFRNRFRKPTILTIENFKSIKLEDLETEVRIILNSVLFDIEYNYYLSYETVNINSLLRRLRRRKKPKYELPVEPIQLTFKKYIPELIDYFHTGEKVDYLPFKYLCYFHIIEYFQDKSAFFVVAEKLKNILLKPDFHLDINNYVSQAINVFKQENEKHLTDKIKIERVFRQYLDLEEFKEYLVEEDLLNYFTKDVVINCSKPLTLPAIDFSTEQKMTNTLTNRIYSMRCSIVHSNPDFDDKKAIPFLPIPENIEILRFEIELIMEIARSIITKSTER